VRSDGGAPSLPYDLYPIAHGEAPDRQPDQLKLLTNIVQKIAAQVETMSLAAAPTKHTTSANPTADFDRATGGRRKHDALQAHSNDNPMEYTDPLE
jgi:hypothetical protein